jgi:intracellular sulfur oxidation DsrE/DsrF family protein
MEDLKKYETELSNVNNALADLDRKRTEIIRHGVRLEGIVAYLRDKAKAESSGAESAELSESVQTADKGD